MSATDIIKALRQKRRLKQEDVANMLGMSRQTYNSLENNLLNNDFTLVFKLLNVLDPNPTDVIEFFNALQQDYMSYKE